MLPRVGQQEGGRVRNPDEAHLEQEPVRETAQGWATLGNPQRVGELEGGRVRKPDVAHL